MLFVRYIRFVIFFIVTRFLRVVVFDVESLGFTGRGCFCRFRYSFICIGYRKCVS